MPMKYGTTGASSVPHRYTHTLCPFTIFNSFSFPFSLLLDLPTDISCVTLVLDPGVLASHMQNDLSERHVAGVSGEDPSLPAGQDYHPGCAPRRTSCSRTSGRSYAMERTLTRSVSFSVSRRFLGGSQGSVTIMTISSAISRILSPKASPLVRTVPHAARWSKRLPKHALSSGAGGGTMISSSGSRFIRSIGKASKKLS
ncbi:hypothetical protein LZ30DRAFT_359568 [Colletotrichum cereale]|nr:hypothetical protein LZ30DRAFT_359568 [Colletotrichum cereale]